MNDDQRVRSAFFEEKYTAKKPKRPFSLSLRRAAYSWPDDSSAPTYPGYQDGAPSLPMRAGVSRKQLAIIISIAAAVIVVVAAIWLTAGSIAHHANGARTPQTPGSTKPLAAGGISPGVAATFPLPPTVTVGTQPGAVATATALAQATLATSATPSAGATATIAPTVSSGAGTVKPAPPTATPLPPPPTPGPGVNVIANPNFENGAAGWGVWPGTSGNDGNASFNETAQNPAHGGAWYHVHWRATPYEVTTYQNIYNIPNGTYTASAWVETGCDTVNNWFLARNPANNQNLAIMQVPSCYQGWTLITLNGIVVTNNQVDIQFYSNNNGNQWIRFDDVSLYR